MQREFEAGIAWGEAKKRLCALIDSEIAEARERYEILLANPAAIERELKKGAEKARAIAGPFMQRLRAAVGIRPLV